MSPVLAQIEHARALQSLGRHQEALDALTAAIGAEPSNATAHSLRAISLAGLHDFREATRASRIALQFAPADAFSHFALGKVMALKGETREARKCARAALQIEPDVADYHGLLAATYQAEGRWSRAIEAVDRGLQIDPENAACLLLKGTVLSFKGRRSDALRIAESLLRIDPHNASGLAFYESLQSEAGVRDVAKLSLQTNPSKSYVKNAALEDILRNSLAFRWVVAVDRIGRRIGARQLALIAIAGGLLLCLPYLTGRASGEGPVRYVVRIGAWTYSVFLFVVVFGWCTGDIYLRFHPSGRWLLSSIRRTGAEIAASGSAIGGALLLAAALWPSHQLAFVGAGIVAAGLCISRSLAIFLRLAPPLEFTQSLAMSSVMMLALAAAAGVSNLVFIGTLAACGLAACVARLVGWPQLK